MSPFGRLAWKPKEVLAPGASAPLCGALPAVTAWPATVSAAFQLPVSVWPGGRGEGDVPAVLRGRAGVGDGGLDDVAVAPLALCRRGDRAAPPVPPPVVVTVTVPERGERLPAASLAYTAKVWAVLTARPVIAAAPGAVGGLVSSWAGSYVRPNPYGN